MASPTRVRSDHVITSPAVFPYKVPANFSSATTTGASTPVTISGGSSVTFIGIGGGRGAGKEHTCRYIIDKVRERGYEELAGRVVHLHLDDFHRELSQDDHAQLEQGVTNINFDHPESFDFELLQGVLQGLKQGKPVDVPVWDHKLRKRTDTRRVDCQPRVVLVEGVLVLYTREIRKFMDMQVFIDVDSDTRLGRQLRAVLRDTGEEEQRTHAVLKGFLQHYLGIAKPSFEEFILPTKRWADVIIPHGDRNNVAIELIAQRLIDLGHEA
ncbi:hypothetical protein GGI12_000014 [Dipsacomyces acuminosporus]|nr:hypothetical protein GGI12_000014 [Dipsacomyces acuminosporus]